ncbi:hypothetical protein AB0D32_24350 [Micromonospora sp. NPDC048170]|uniref:hypothetical protein n=1 Tax=Micromonospora sp. NPDC048170 TaxID=3154819 RepID=UPI00340EC61A
MSEEQKGRALEAALADAAAIRATIERKANHNQALVGVHLTAVAAVAGFVLSEKADIRMFLLLPVLSAALGLSVVSQYRDIRIAGQYIEQVLRPTIARYTSEPGLFGWEAFYWQRKHDGHVAQALAMGMIFPGVSVLALAVTFPGIQGAGDKLAWAVGAVMLLILIGAWSNRLREMVRARWAQFRAPARRRTNEPARRTTDEPARSDGGASRTPTVI